MDHLIQTYEVVTGEDDTGELEELTWDLAPVVDPRETLHLGEQGVPRVGTWVRPGMILIGRIGKSAAYRMGWEPTALEWQGVSFAELRERFGGLWVDRSFRMPGDVSGEVIESRVEPREGGRWAAFVRVRTLPMPS